MRIDRIDLYHVAVPLPAPVHPAWIPGFAQTENRFDLIRLVTASGIEGWSAAPSMGTERGGWGQLLGSYFLGERADDLENLRQRIREMGYLGHLAGWIEPALWDILGKARQLPVWSLLGGEGGSVRLYASTGEVRSGADRVREVAERLAEGFDAVKLRVHAASLEEDLAQLRAVREAHPDVVLGVDANQGWRVAAIAEAPRWDLARARAFCREAEALGFAWVEEPLPMDAYDELATLSAETEIPISGGELNHGGPPEFDVLLRRRSLDWYQPDAVMTGGLAATWAIQRRVLAAGRHYSPHTWTNGIGFAINLQLFAATPHREQLRLEYPLDPPGWVPEARDGLLTRPWRQEGGRLAIPDGPGLGFEIDKSALSRWGKHFYTATKTRVALRTVVDRGLAQARALGATRSARLEARDQLLEAQIAAGADPFMDAARAVRCGGEPPPSS